jgi:ribonuclease III
MNDLQDFNRLYQQKTSVAFCDLEQARQALTHDSIGTAGEAFERMEFLGDGCLEMVMALLLVTHTDFPEGKMSQLRSRLTSKESLAQRTKAWNIEPWMVVGKAMDMEALPDTIYADTFESLLGALFLDQGFDAVHRAVEAVFLQEILEARDSGLNFASPKTQLQEW